MSDKVEKLTFLLALQKRLGGSIPFDRWMREALYHEKFGYYTTKIRELGRHGDFTTWPVLNESLGHAIGKWILQKGSSGGQSLIEIGAGSGELAATVIKTMGWWKRPRYHIVEISPRLREAQQQRLGSKAVWHRSVAEALLAAGGSAILFSNELVDAFPCRVFAKDVDRWRELALRIDEMRVVEEWITSPLPDSTAFLQPWFESQRVEVHESYHCWLREWLPVWKAGSMLTIDYGDHCPALYSRRPRGTLRAYAHHQRLEGSEVYNGFGLRDLTADVNFSDLERQGSLTTATFSSLGEFLSRYAPSPARDNWSANFFARGGAGEAFKVLIQER